MRSSMRLPVAARSEAEAAIKKNARKATSTSLAADPAATRDVPGPDALYGHSRLRALGAAAASGQMNLEIFLAIIVEKLFARLDGAEREDIYAPLADIDLAIRRAGMVDEAGGIHRYVAVDHARVARPEEVLPAILLDLFGGGGASEVFDDA